MSELEDKLNAILSDPEAMAQVMGLAQSLNAAGAFSGTREADDSAPHHSQQKENPSPPFSGAGSLFSGLDPGMLQRLLPLLGEFSGGENDEKAQLLYALRPFLKPERQEKVERAIRAAKLIRIGKKIITSMGESNV